MPYKVIGCKVYHKLHSKWRVKQVAHSHAKALATVRLLRAVEHGWKPTGRRRRGMF